MLELRPLRTRDLREVERWFDDAETQRWLGGRDWPAQSLRLAGETRHVLLASAGGDAVAMIDVETYPDARASFAIVVAPAARRSGIGRATLNAVIDHHALSAVTEWFAGIERGNDASRRLVEALGFRRVTEEDADGFTYYALGEVASPWSPPD